MHFCGGYAVSRVSHRLIMAAVHPIRGIGISEQLLILDAPDKYILNLKNRFRKAVGPHPLGYTASNHGHGDYALDTQREN